MIEFHIAQLCVAEKPFYAPNVYFVINSQTQTPTENERNRVKRS